MEEIFIGRQPIFNRNKEVVAYELLFRSANMDNAQFTDGNYATSVVLSHTFIEMGLDSLVGDKLAFINLTRSFLMGEYPLPPQPERLVLEVLEDIQADDELVVALTKLADQGFKIALDDVVNPLDVAMLLDLAHIVKVDLMASDLTQLPKFLPVYKARNVELLAEKIENQAEFQMCKDWGFDYFQGYFLQKPEIIRSRKLTASKVVIMRLLGKLQDDHVSFQEIEASFRQDLALTYKLLRLINSAYYGVTQEITSIHQALTLLGIEQLRSWVSLLLLAETETKPQELLKTAMIRGKMAELLAQITHRPHPSIYFTVGLFSVLDALMDMKLEDILGQVTLSEEVNDALLHRKGDLGEMLSCVLAYEAGDIEHLQYRNLKLKSIRECYFDAVRWADKTVTDVYTLADSPDDATH